MNFFNRFRGNHKVSTYAVLEIDSDTAGQSAVSLISPGTGIHLQEWIPQMSQPKDGGVYHSSPQRDGRKLVRKRRDSVIETFTYAVDGVSQSEVALHLEDLIAILDSSTDYSTGITLLPGWIKLKPGKMDVPLYAEVIDWSIAELAPVMYGSLGSSAPALGSINLLIERGEWSRQKPLNPRQIPIASYACYQMVLNSSFEEWTLGNPGNWTKTGTPTVTQSTSFVQSGNYTAKIVNGSTSADRGLWQDIDYLDNSLDYVITFSFYVESVGTGGLGVSVAAYDSGGFTDETRTNVSTTGYHTIELTKQSDANGKMRLAIFAQSAGATVYVDDISLCRYRGNADQDGIYPTIVNPVYIDNRHTKANITHMIKYDATFASYEHIFFDQDTIVNFFSDVAVATGDILYIGIASSIFDVTAPFDNLVFNIITAEVGGTYTISYWNGGGWSSIASATSLLDYTNTFTETGQKTMHWRIPSNWASNGIVDGINAWWVRIVVGTAPTTQPRQQGPIWTIATPFVEIDEDEIIGDINALSKIELENISDNGDATDADDLRQLAADMVFIGLRSTGRGENFTPYINLDNTNNHSSIAVSTVTSITEYSVAPTGGINRHNVAVTTTYENGPQVTINGNLVDEYTGVFHAFVQMSRELAAGTVDVRLAVYIDRVTGNTPVFTSKSFRIPSTTSRLGSVADLGEVALPGIGEYRSGEIGKVVIVLQSLSSNASEFIRWWTLILMPVDEWAGKFINERAVAMSTDNYNSLGRYDLVDLTHRTYLRVDSIGKDDIRCIVCETENDHYVATWQQEANDRCLLRPKVKQRLWFFTAKYLDASGSRYLFAYPGQVHKVRVYAIERHNLPIVSE